MTIPKLKRIKVSSVDELRNKLGKEPETLREVVIVTCDKSSPEKYLSSDLVREVLAELGWTKAQSYTLAGNLVGHRAQLR